MPVKNNNKIIEGKDKFTWGIGGALLIFFMQGNFDLVQSNQSSTIATSEQAKFIFEELKEIKQELKDATKDRWSKNDHTLYAREVGADIGNLENRFNEQTRSLRMEIQEIKDLIRGKIK